MFAAEEWHHLSAGMPVLPPLMRAALPIKDAGGVSFMEAVLL